MKKSTLINDYAHDYRNMNLGEEGIRAMLTEYTREYEDAIDDVGGMEITEGMQKFVTIFFLALTFIIGLCIGLWIG